jgi:O-antigen/teichoic acid export membrane protein
MTLSVGRVARNILNFGSGEVISRLCSIATLLVLARRYGVVIVGVFALAQGMLQYSYPIIDFGLRHVGARLIATMPSAESAIVRRVQSRRAVMASLLLLCFLVYAAFVKLPTELRIFLFAFAATGCLYALSLDWAAWGKEQLGLASFGRAVVPISILTSLILAKRSGGVLWWLLGGSIIGNVLQAAIFWFWWERHRPAGDEEIYLASVQESLAWRRTSVVGLAWLCNLAFNTIDVLMLGVMSNAHQVGFYSVAYRIVNQILVTYYLMTIVLYPQLARQNARQRAAMLRPRILVALAVIGFLLAVSLMLLRRTLLVLLFGEQFLPASRLLTLLAWAIPFDFLTSYLSNAYIAWGMEKKVLACTAAAAISNIILNLVWIPSHGAIAAAVNTLISYVIFLVSLTIAGYSAIDRATGSELLPEAPGFNELP